MAKGNGKKIKRKFIATGQPNATIKKVKGKTVSTTPTNPAPATEPEEAKDKEKSMEKAKRIAGFIFMCNPSTKLQCYQYRVFGLPSGMKEVVQEIKPGTKLFLFDFERKLLYGIYEATSTGKLNLEPNAFRGKFPAQVKFRIFKECLPLPESSLRHIIQENYSGSKFKQELSAKQVRKLISSFRPLNASSSPLSQPTPQSHVSLSRAMPPSAMQNQFKHTAPPAAAMKAPYLYQGQYGCIPNSTLTEPHLQHGYHRTSSSSSYMNPNLEHRSLPTTTSSYYVANSQRSSFAEGVAQPPYSRYRVIDERAPPHPPNDQVSSLERRYMAVEETAPRDQVTVSERRYHHNQQHQHQLPSQRESLYQDNNVSAYNNSQYASSVSQPNVHAAYYPSPLQISSQYQNSTAAYNSNQSAAPVQYSTSSASANQIGLQHSYHQLPSQGETMYRDNVNVGVYSNSYAGASAYYASSAATQPPPPPVTAPPVLSSQVSAPITAYYSYNPANWQSR